MRFSRGEGEGRRVVDGPEQRVIPRGARDVVDLRCARRQPDGLIGEWAGHLAVVVGGAGGDDGSEHRGERLEGVHRAGEALAVAGGAGDDLVADEAVVVARLGAGAGGGALGHVDEPEAVAGADTGGQQRPVHGHDAGCHRSDPGIVVVGDAVPVLGRGAGGLHAAAEVARRRRGGRHSVDDCRRQVVGQFHRERLVHGLAVVEAGPCAQLDGGGGVAGGGAAQLHVAEARMGRGAPVDVGHRGARLRRGHLEVVVLRREGHVGADAGFAHRLHHHPVGLRFETQRHPHPLAVGQRPRQAHREHVGA